VKLGTTKLSTTQTSPDVNLDDPSAQVRDLFNSRAGSWSNHYKRGGKMNWRLDQFCTVVREAAPSPALVLDFGCGTGQLANHLCDHQYQVTACDMADRMIARAQENFGSSDVNWVGLSADWRRLPFASQTFDAVVASCVLEYVVDLNMVFGELARVLRDGGVFVFNVPNPESGRRKRERWVSRLTGPRWIRRMACIIPRMMRFLTYLELSKNRLSLRRWEAIGADHGFYRVPHVSNRTIKRALFLFVLQKRRVPEQAFGASA
jgi:ubiquinone/menaquinone biosynthesis C-methylase UbiE